MYLRHLRALLTPLIALVVALPITAAPAAEPQLAKTLVLGEWRPTPAQADLAATASPELEPPPELFSRPADPENWLRLVYSSLNGQDFDIWRAIRIDHPDGSVAYSQAPVVEEAGDDIGPRLSPDLSTVLFSSNRQGSYDLYRVAAFGGEVSLVVGGLGDQIFGAWSPDGRSIVYSSNQDGNLEIYSSGAGGSGARRLTFTEASDGKPSWSPDGRTIIWARWSGDHGAVWAMDADGRNQRALTGPLRYLGTPVWSPDGTQIALDYDANGDGFNQVAVMASNGKGLRTLATSTKTPGFVYDVMVNAWSPDGARVFAATGLYYVGSGRAQLVNLFIGRVTLNQSDLFRTTSAEGTAYPDARSVDQQPPESTLSQLPLYKRAGPLSVTLVATDYGIAQIRSYALEARRNGGPWQVAARSELLHLEPHVSADLVYSGGVPGDVIDLRGRAVDDAGNSELAPAAGELRVTLFAGQVQGRITDNRGQPAVASLGPSPAGIGSTTPDSQGRYLVRTITNGTQTFAPTAPGFKALPATSFSMASDRVLHMALVPADDLFGDGSFETDTLGGWTASGDLSAPQVAGAGLTGLKALKLGTPCASPCLGNPVGGPQGMYSSSFTAADDGTEHVIFTTNSNSPVFHSQRSPGGLWSEATNISPPDAYGFQAQSVIVGADGAVHAVYSWGNSDVSLYSVTRSAAGVWSVPVYVGPTSNAGETKLFRGTAGRIILVSNCFNRPGCLVGTPTYVRVLSPGSGWGAAQPIAVAPQFTGAIGPNGVLYLTWRNFESVNITTVGSDGRQLNHRMVAPSQLNTNDHPGIAVDQGSMVHLFWGELDGNRSMSCNAALECSQANKLGVKSALMTAAADPQGIIHIGGDNLYWQRLPDGSFTPPLELGAPGYGHHPEFVLDGGGNIHIFYGAMSRSTATIATAGVTTLTRQVTIPADMHRPTLSFVYKLMRSGSASGLQVQVLTEEGASTVFTSTTATASGHAWADLSPWSGRTVTVMISLIQMAHTSPVELILDDIALGSWQTPVLSGVSPTRVASFKPTTLTISGTNLLDGGKVFLGEMELAGVTRVNETTLQVTVPPGMKPGVYRLSVGNPGGPRAAFDGMLVGERVFAPLIVR